MSIRVYTWLGSSTLTPPDRYNWSSCVVVTMRLVANITVATYSVIMYRVVFYSLLWLIYPPNLKSLPLAVMEIWNALKIHKMAVVRGHPRSWAVPLFDRACIVSYSSLIETMRLCFTVFEIRRVIYWNSPTSIYPTCIWRHRWGWLRLNFEKIFGFRKLESQAIIRCCLCHPMFRHLIT